MKIRNYERTGTIRFYDLNSRKTKIALKIIVIICIAMVIISLFPIIWVFLSGFKDIKEFNNSPTILPQTFDISRYIKTWKDLGFTKYYINSGITTLGGVIAAVVFNGLLAYGLGVIRPRGYKIVYGLVMWSLLIPPTTSIVTLYININKLGLSGSFAPLWLSMGANAFWVVLFKEFFEDLPRDYFEAAQIDGCSNLQIFFRIIIPLSKPIIMVVVIYAITACWSDFLLPFLVLGGTSKETVMVRLFAFRTALRATDMDILRAVAFAIIPPTILFALFQDQITRQTQGGGIKG